MDSAVAKQKYDSAVALFKKGRVAESLNILQELRFSLPENRELLYASALCLITLGREYEALPLVKLLETNYSDPRTAQLRRKIDGLAMPHAPTYRISPTTQRTIKIGDVVTFPCGRIWGALRVISDHEHERHKLVVAVSTWFSTERPEQLSAWESSQEGKAELADEHLRKVLCHNLNPNCPALYRVSQLQHLPALCSPIGTLEPTDSDRALYAKHFRSYNSDDSYHLVHLYDDEWETIFQQIRIQYDTYFGTHTETQLRMQCRTLKIQSIENARVAEIKRQATLNGERIVFPYGCPTCHCRDNPSYIAVEASGFPACYVCSKCHSRSEITRDGETRFPWQVRTWLGERMYYVVDTCARCSKPLSWYSLHGNRYSGNCLSCGYHVLEEDPGA